MHILVNGTEVTAWGDSPQSGEGVPFEVDDFPGAPEPGARLHWDGIRWWEDGSLLPAEAVALALRGSLTDAEAARLAPYLPDVDPSRRYAEGEVARHDGRAVRKTATGWRRLG